MRILIVLVIAIPVLSGCSASLNYSDAKNATNTFHHLSDSGQYTVIYDAAAEGFQKAASRDIFIGYMSRINRKMGQCGEGSVVALAGYKVTTSGTFVITTSSRMCSNGKLDEQFAWLMVQGKATLFKYNANNPLLLTD